MNAQRRARLFWPTRRRHPPAAISVQNEERLMLAGAAPVLARCDLHLCGLTAVSIPAALGIAPGLSQSMDA